MDEIIRENGDEIRPFTWWERLKYVFIAPNKAFENLAKHPKVLFPILFFTIGVILLMFLRFGLYKEFLLETIREQYALQGLDVPENIEGMVNIQVYVSIFFIAVMPLVVWVIKSAIVNGVAALIGGEGTFKQAFSIIAYSYMPVLLGQIVVTVISLIIGEFNVPMSFAILLPETMEGNFLYNLLSQFDIFIIWYQILAIIGVSHVYEIDKKKAAIPVLISWFTWILITAGIGTLSSTMMKRA